eukprot:COSAG04_NODE_7496_length_1118_cov_0.850834_2_plen_165_part_01
MTSLKYITAATRSVLAAAGADGALVLIAADPARRPHSKYVPPGAELAQPVEPRRAALEGFAPSVRRAHTPCAEAAPPLRSRTDTGGGAALRFARWRYAGWRRPIAHERRRCLAGSRSVRDGCCGLRPRREDRCIGREAHLRLSTHQVPLARLSHASWLSERYLSP